MSILNGGQTPKLGLSLRVAETVAADLRKQILNSEEDGVPLPRQEDLIRQYGVSGPSLREALRILEAEGLITVRRGKFGGAYVHKPNWSSAAYAFALSLQGQGVTLNDVAESLLTFEPLCIADCANRTDRLDNLVPALEANLEAARARMGDGPEYSREAREFHEILVSWSMNVTTRLLVRSLTAIWSVQEQIWAYSMSSQHMYPGKELQELSHKAHFDLVQHIKAGDADRATRLSRAHLEATQRVVLDRYGDEVVDASSLAAVQAFKSL